MTAESTPQTHHRSLQTTSFNHHITIHSPSSSHSDCEKPNSPSSCGIYTGSTSSPARQSYDSDSELKSTSMQSNTQNSTHQSPSLSHRDQPGSDSTFPETQPLRFIIIGSSSNRCYNHSCSCSNQEEVTPRLHALPNRTHQRRLLLNDLHKRLITESTIPAINCNHKYSKRSQTRRPAQDSASAACSQPRWSST